MYVYIYKGYIYRCTNHNETLEELVEDGGFVQQENNIQYTVKLNRDEDSVWCMGSFKYDEDEELCGESPNKGYRYEYAFIANWYVFRLRATKLKYPPPSLSGQPK